MRAEFGLQFGDDVLDGHVMLEQRADAADERAGHGRLVRISRRAGHTWGCLSTGARKAPSGGRWRGHC